MRRFKQRTKLANEFILHQKIAAHTTCNGVVVVVETIMKMFVSSGKEEKRMSTLEQIQNFDRIKK
jgi:Na+-transporting methylmalonyl-CoA/oxaloacetate decarboxylase beta subunit